MCIAALLAGAAIGTLAADEHEVNPKTVLGPRNPPLAEGAQALLRGDAERGLRLTRRGLEMALGRRERQAGLSNMCAGHVMLEQFHEALDYCNRALAENENNWRALCNRALIYTRLGRFDEADTDLDKAEALAPRARAIKEVRGMYLDATDPVQPNIVIDDRRGGDNSDNNDDS